MEHVNFTMVDQQFHFNALMSLHKVFVGSGKAAPIKGIAEVRSTLREAKTMGVHPSYAMCGKQLIQSLSDVSQQVYHALHHVDLVEPNLLNHSKFDQQDATEVINLALARAQAEINKALRYDDSESRGTEAGHNVGAMSASLNKSGSTLNSDAQSALDRQLNLSAEVHDLDRKQKSVVRKEIMQKPVSNEIEKIEEQVEACALMLSDGQVLSDTAIRSKMAGLRGFSRGSERQRSAQPGKGKSSSCLAKGCDETPPSGETKQGRKYQHALCDKHFKLHSGGTKVYTKSGDLYGAKSGNKREYSKKQSGAKKLKVSADSAVVSVKRADGTRQDEVISAHMLQLMTDYKNDTIVLEPKPKKMKAAELLEQMANSE
jgi:hypothetical protein